MQSLARCPRCRWLFNPVAFPPTQSRPALQLAAEVERMGAVDGGVSISLDAVYSMFNTA